MSAAAALTVASAACAETGATSSDPAASVDEGAKTGEHDEENNTSIINSLSAEPTFAVSTIPPSGDVNPYGVAFVPKGFPEGGLLQRGDILVSNFNNSDNVQGTGSSIVIVHPDGTQSLFFQGPPGLGLSTALGVLKSGFVIVGNVPSSDGTGMCVEVDDTETGVGQGALTILDRNANVVTTLANEEFLNGPWDLTILDLGRRAYVFVSNVLSGTVTRLDLEIRGPEDDGDCDENGNDNETGNDNGHDGAKLIVKSQTQIASGYLHRCDSAAFVVGPTGLALDERRGILYVSSTGDNAIFAIDDAIRRRTDAGMGTVFIDDQEHLHGPLGLARAPNGHLLSAQGDAVNFDPDQVSEIVEFDREGNFVAQFSIDQMSGAAFGLAIRRFLDGFIFAAVDDATNMLKVWVVP